MSTQTIIAQLAILALFFQSCGPGIPQPEAPAVRLNDLSECEPSARAKETSSTYSLSSTNVHLVFQAGSRKLLASGMLVWMNAPAAMRRGRWTVSPADANGTVGPILRPGTYVDPVANPVVVLDPGHGGGDNGATGRRGLKEKDVTLDVALRVQRQLAAAGVAVRLTRGTDKAVELADRSVMARRAGADLFVSIHANSSRNPDSKGIETYLMTAAGHTSTAETGRAQKALPGNAFDGANMVLAYQLHRSLLNNGATEDRGVKRARFSVLRDAGCPAVLTEIGFISNSREESNMASGEHRERIASGISAGILSYLRYVKPVRAAT